MPKKRSDDDIEAYVNRKIRKIEKKLKKRRERRQRSPSQDSDNTTDDRSGEDCSLPLEPPPQSGTAQNTDPMNEVIVEVPVSDTVEVPVITPPALTSEPIVVDVHEDNLPEEILEILGESPTSDKKYGPALNSNLAIRWEHTATNGLPKEVRKELFTKHDIPENCKNIDAPVLNQEIKAALSEVLIKKDKAIEQKQKQIALIITCLGEALSQVLPTGNLSLIKSLTNAGKLACDLQHTESMIHRSFICSSIKKEIKDHLYTTQVDSHLFGSQLSEVLKAAKTINKTGAEMKTVPTPGPSRRTSSQAQNLNARRPLTTVGRQTGGAARRPTGSAVNSRPEYRRQQRRAPPPPPRASYKRSQTRAPHR